MDSPPKDWHSFSLVIPEAAVDDVSACCFELGTCGLEVTDIDRPGAVKVVAYFAADTDAAGISDGIRERLCQRGVSSPEPEQQSISGRDWSVEWRKYFTPVQVTSRIVVHPPWISVDAEIPIAIYPKMAFGTGGHESTRLSLKALEDQVQGGSDCLDIGTGSGILAIAAVLLGAGSVLALDTDQSAIENAGENLARNLSGRPLPELRLGSVEEAKEARFDLAVANMQSSTLAPILPCIRERLVAGGVAIFSGLLAPEGERFRTRLAEVGFIAESTHRENEWICIVARRGR